MMGQEELGFVPNAGFGWAIGPPQWQDTSSGYADMFTQGVYNPAGQAGSGPAGKTKMSMVAMGPGGVPMFEGEKGFMQCSVNPMTGEYRTDAQGNAQCWYVPTTATAQSGRGRRWLNTDDDIVGPGLLYGNDAPAPVMQQTQTEWMKPLMGMVIIIVGMVAAVVIVKRLM